MQIAGVQAQARCQDAQGLTSYDAPRIEAVLTPVDIEREIHYAGSIISCPGGDCPPK